MLTMLASSTMTPPRIASRRKSARLRGTPPQHSRSRSSQEELFITEADGL